MVRREAYDPAKPMPRLLLTDPLTHAQMVDAGPKIREACGFGGTFLGVDQVQMAVTNGHMRTLLRELWAAYEKLEGPATAWYEAKGENVSGLVHRHHDLLGHLLALGIVRIDNDERTS